MKVELPKGIAAIHGKIGNLIFRSRKQPDGTYRVCGQDGTFLCLSRAEGGTLTSIKNFFGA